MEFQASYELTNRGGILKMQNGLSMGDNVEHFDITLSAKDKALNFVLAFERNDETKFIVPFDENNRQFSTRDLVGITLNISLPDLLNDERDHLSDALEEAVQPIVYICSEVEDPQQMDFPMIGDTIIFVVQFGNSEVKSNAISLTRDLQGLIVEQKSMSV